METVLVEKNSSTGIRYIKFGSGRKTMVVVPGLSIGFVTDNAPAVAGVFSAFIDDYTVYLFDVREDVPSGYTIAQMGEDLATTIKDLGLSNIYMYGCSMGGMETIYVAGTYPGLVEKAVIVSSACKANGNAKQVIGEWNILAREGKYHELSDEMGKKIYSPAVYEANKEMFASMADSFTEELITRFINNTEAIRNLDLTDKAKAIACPVFVIGSKGDKVITGEASVELAEITGGKLYLYEEESSHAIYDEESDLRGMAKDFFDGIDK